MMLPASVILALVFQLSPVNSFALNRYHNIVTRPTIYTLSLLIFSIKSRWLLMKSFDFLSVESLAAKASSLACFSASS